MGAFGELARMLAAIICEMEAMGGGEVSYSESTVRRSCQESR